MNAREIAERCQELGARVEIRGPRWWVFPPDRNMPPVIFSALAGHLSGNGTAQANLLSDLRKRGIDLLEGVRADQNPKPRPETAPSTTPEEHQDMTQDTTQNGVTPVPYTVDGTVKPFDYRKAYNDLREQAKTLDLAVQTSVRNLQDHVKRQDTALVGMVAEQEGRITEMGQEQDRRIRELAARVHTLEQLLAKAGTVEAVVPAPPAPPTKAELLRRAVLAFYAEHKGLKLSPMAVRANIEEDQKIADMLTVMPPTSVAGACRELVKAGHLMGGGKVGGPMNPNHGVYWMPKPEDKPEAKAGSKGKGN